MWNKDLLGEKNQPQMTLIIANYGYLVEVTWYTQLQKKEAKLTPAY